MVEIFTEFLKKNQILMKFIKNLRKRRGERMVGDKEVIIRKWVKYCIKEDIPLRDFLTEAFLFEGTEEGFKFWWDKHLRWVSTLEE